ncbi:MAG: hypothetical protein ACI83P_001423 [Janthinobacterium sp.]|jgi:hypothetical protein
MGNGEIYRTANIGVLYPGMQVFFTFLPQTSGKHKVATTLRRLRRR